MNTWPRLYGIGTLVCAAALVAAGEPVSGRITAVAEGDLLSFSHGNTVETIRLADIDCPELAQSFGKEARDFTAAIVLDKDVQVEMYGMDAQKRPLAVVRLGDGRVLNRELASEGYAWAYDRYPVTDPTIPGMMAAARAGKKGLWVEAAPLAPWDFRGDALKERADQSVPAAGDPSDLPSGGAVFIDADGKEFHKADCVMLDKSSRRSLMLKDAQAQGYSPCRRCFPIKPRKDAPVVAAKGNLGDIPKEEFPLEAPRPSAPPPQAATRPAPPAAMDDLPLPPEVAKYMNDPIVQSLGLAPYRDANGNITGIAAKNISSFLPAAMLGFKDNDVLLSVNGDRIDPNRIPALIEKYKNTRSFEVGILRNGQPQTISVTIPDFIK